MRRFLKLLLPILILPIVGITGCGGGGGGSSTTTFTLNTNWVNASATGGGQSVQAQLFDPTGALVQSFVLNAAATVTTTAFTGLKNGTYHLEVQLFNLTNAGGSQTGQLDLAFNPTTTKTLTEEVGSVPARVGVTPNNVSIPVQNTEQYYATAYAQDGNATFTAPGTITWSVLNTTVGSIDPSAGLFTSLAAGAGSVQASYAPSALLGAATVTVTPISTTQGTWTVMVFLNAANDLQPYALPNFLQMQNGTVNGNNVRTVVQWKETAALGYPNPDFDGTRRYLVQHSTSSGIASQLVQDLGSGVDMGSYQTLNQFINWAKTYYPAQHYALIIWDHGTGWRGAASKKSPTYREISFDDETGNVIQTYQLSSALGNNHLDIFSCDACLMQMAEVDDQIASQVDYIAGSEDNTPGPGYYYNLILNEFNANPSASPRTLSKAFVDSMINGYAGDTVDTITQAVIDTSKLPSVMTAIKNLGTALDTNISQLTPAIQATRNSAQSFDLLVDTRYYFDLSNLTTVLDTQLSTENLSIPAITSANAAVRSAVSAAVVWNGHNNLDPNANGLSIDFSPGSVFSTYATNYAQLKMATDTSWNIFLLQAP